MAAGGRTAGTPVPSRRRVPVGALVAGLVAVGLVAGSVLVDGFDVQETTRVETSVWVARDDGRYARFDTDLDQIDTVRQVEDPTQVVQHGATALVLAQGRRALWPVDPANPADLRQDGDVTAATSPDGTVSLAHAGDWMAFLTDSGEVWVDRLDGAGAAQAARLRPAPEAAASAGASGDQAGAGAAEETPYVATAATVDPQGRVAVYSAAEHAVRVLDAASGELLADPAPLADPPAADAPVQVALVAGAWAVLDPDSGRVWLAGRERPVELDGADGALLQQSALRAWGALPQGAVVVADERGLVVVDATGATRAVSYDGTPTVPTALDDGDLVAAWLTPAGGRLWTASAGAKDLVVAPGTLDRVQQIRPVVSANGERAVLTEASTGLLWTVPDGAAIPEDQWSELDRTSTEVGTRRVEQVTEQMPPSALPDSFGVRAGTDVRLPVLLNDSDPNADDALTIAAGSVTPLSDPDFGTVTLADHDQLAVAHVSATSGSTTFTYQVTDGIATSEPVTVTLEVVDPTTDRAPAWCPVEGCAQTWPTAMLAPGGTAQVRLLDEWVDPDGDPFVLTSATVDDPTAPVRVVADAEGMLTLQHVDPNGSAGAYPVTLTVTDATGQAATRTLQVQVTAAPALDLEPVAVVVGPGVPAAIVAADHVRSGSGSYRLVDAVASTGSAGQLAVTPNATDGTVQVTAAAAGQYQLTYTVKDLVTGIEQTAVARVQCSPDAAGASLGPMTAFVRDHEDTTVDVIAAVQATTDRVLTLASATTTDPALGVDVVDGARLRLRGSTPDGQPGLVGTTTVTVTDGASVTATGTISVFLVPSATGQAPIAVPDAVTVRAGAQVDIPVTANDVAPGGGRLVLAGEVVGSGADGELVFTAGTTVRYLAPSTPGTYALDYTVALATDADALASASVTVTVVPRGANRPPAPRELTGRASAGARVRLPFDGRGADPDGDPVTLVQVTQPPAGQGLAKVSATGDAIVYQASPSMVTGDQVSFTYTVRDSAGAEGTATVRVGVLSAAEAAAPIAYTDRVRVRAGETVPVTVEPLLNDRDPGGGTLTLTGLRPDAPTAEANPERARLDGLVDPGTSLEDGVLRLAAGDVLGVHSYVYTVSSSATGSTAEGLVVVEVTDATVSDPPVVSDTVLTAQQRAELPGEGVDVVSGKVTWPGGDASGLTLAVWGPAAQRYEVRGGRIVGELPAAGDLVPFSLTGADHDGDEVVGYGFLRIPAFDDMRVDVRADIPPVQVDEGAQVEVDLADLVRLGRGDVLEVDASGSHPVQRPAATCVSVGTARLLYSAGNGAPWRDTCVVGVRIAGQRTWTSLVVPFDVAPQDPQAVLTAISRTVAPGASETVDLLSMLTWEGGRVGDVGSLAFDAALGAGQGSFTLVQTGTSVTVTASAKAVPGSRATVDVRVTSVSGLTSSIQLVVGQAAPDAPRGATVTATCDVSSGAGCTVPVVDVSGEYDPFAGKPDSGLVLDHVGGTGSFDCQVATVQAVDQRSVRVTWPSGPKPAGGTCKVPFTVADAQGRLGTGLLDLDVLGYPGQPASLTLQGYTGTSVTVDVALGQAATAHPPVTGAAVYERGTRVSDQCVPAGASAYRCTVPGLVNGSRHELTGRVVNSVGESADTSTLTAWAYQAPAMEPPVARPIYAPDAGTTDMTGVVEVELRAADDVGGFVVVDSASGQQVTVERRGAVTTATLVLPTGARTLVVTPRSRFSPPLGAPDSSGGSATVQVTSAGLPRVTPGAVSVDGTTLTVTGASVDANGSDAGTRLVYALSTSGLVRCDADRDGELVDPHGGDLVVQESGTFAGLTNNARYWVTVCASNGFGAAGGTPEPRGTVIVSFGAPTVTTGYVVRPSWSRSGFGYSYTSVTAPVVSAERWASVQYSYDGGASWASRFTLPSTGVPAPGSLLVRQCSSSFTDFCSATTPVTAEPGSALAPVVVSVSRTCSAETPPFSLSSGALSGRATPSVVVDSAANTATWTLTWDAAGPYAGLDDLTIGACDLPAPPPDPPVVDPPPDPNPPSNP